MNTNRNIWTIMKKELSRFFGDRRIVISTILLPGLLIYIMYSFMGNALAKNYGTDEDAPFHIAAVALPATIEVLLPDEAFTVERINREEVEAGKEAVRAHDLDALIVFPANFDAAVALMGMADSTPQVEIYYNASDSESLSAYAALTELLDGYEASLANVFDVNAPGTDYNLASDRDATGFVFSSMLPMLLMIFLFSGCMSVAPEAIAGEKERGTLATILVTPTRRGELAIGKILAVSIVALLSAASSTAGTLLSLPKLMGGVDESMSAAYYTAGDYAALAAVIFSTALLLVALISVISAYAKTIKEAQTTVSALMVVVMIIAVTSMFGSGAKTQLAYYCIPLYNSVQMMVGIFSFASLPAAFGVTVAVNLVLAALAAYALTRMFSSERVMFRR